MLGWILGSLAVMRFTPKVLLSERLHVKHILPTTVILAAAVFLAGCEGISEMNKKIGKAFETDKYRLFDSSKVVQPHEGSPVTPIYANSSDADITDELPPNATPPTPEDLTYSDRDYIIGPTDVLDISILDLLENGVETVLRRQVTTSGHIDLPMLKGKIRAEGVNKEQLTETIKAAYAKNILADPIVAVTISAKRQSTYSILGAVAGPGTYQIERRDLRLLNALAAARGITQQNIKYIYVIRPEPAKVLNPNTPETGARPVISTPVPTSRVAPPPLSRPGVSTPGTKPATGGGDSDTTNLRELGALLGGPGDDPKTKPATKPATGPAPNPALNPAVIPTFVETSSVAAAASTSAEAGPQADGKSEKWIFSNGKWIKTIQEAPVAPKPSGRGAPTVAPVRTVQDPVTKTKSVAPIPRSDPTPVTRRDKGRNEAFEDPYNWKDADKSSLARVIFIDLKRLQQGDPRLNIVIRDNDIIRVPSLEVGEFYVMGEVQRPGVYTLTGRRVTIKMALAAAGNLGPLAYPENSVLVRRIGEDQEQTISINVRAICAGTEPDQFLKPNDVLEIGTHWKTSFLAVVRNAFRVSYGFGMIYDRNFGSPVRQSEHMNSLRFSRW